MTDVGWDFNYDWDEADEVKPFVAVPNGIYQVVVSDVNIETTKNNEPMPALQLSIENHEEYDGQNLFDRWYMPNKQRQTEKAFKKTLGFMKQRLEALYGQPWSGSRKLDVFDLIGRRAMVQVAQTQDPRTDSEGNKVYDEKGVQQFFPPKNEIKWWYPLQQSAAQAAQPVLMGGQPMAAPQPAMAMAAPNGGGVPMTVPPAAPSATSAPSAAPAVQSPAPTQPAPAAAPSVPEAAPQQQGESDPSSTFRL
jgi:hypothetical protein